MTLIQALYIEELGISKWEVNESFYVLSCSGPCGLKRVAFYADEIFIRLAGWWQITDLEGARRYVET